MMGSFRRRKGPSVALVGVGLAATLVLTGCSQGATAQPGSPAADGLPSEHVHGISRDPGSGKVNLATHTGIFVLQSDANWQRVGPEVDFMGFAISGPGTFYGSGHPGAGVDLPVPVGLIKSTDAGRTWTSLSRGGKSDFHALTASSSGVMAFDGALATTKDGQTWSPGALPGEPSALAAAPDGSQVLATTNQGVLSSTDEGLTWVPLASAPPLFLASWADSKTVAGVTTQGELAVSEDAGGSWKIGAAKVSSAQAASANRDKAGVLEILVVTDTGVLQSRDSGATLTSLKS
ncbi:MAG: F510_1955 family glycosylhydrolase [Dermatophilaceae bacterium]